MAILLSFIYLEYETIIYKNKLKSSLKLGVKFYALLYFYLEPISSDLKDKERQAALSREETSSNEGRDSRKDSTSSYGSSSAFGFISDDRAPEDIVHEAESTSEQTISSEMSNYLPLESSCAHDGVEQTPVVRERPSVGGDTVAGKDESAIIVSKSKRNNVSDDYCGDESKIGGGIEAGGDPDSRANRSDIEIQSQTLEDLKGIIGQNLEDVSYDVSLDEDEKFELYVETLKSREKSLRLV